MTEGMTVNVPDISKKAKSGQDVAPELPLRKDAPVEDRSIAPRQKDFHKTIGSKLTQFLIYDVLGFGANSALSVGITYFVMPQKWVSGPKEGLAKVMQPLFKGSAENRFRSANRTLEILIMMVSGTVLTAGMAPLVERRDRIAHWINKKLGKDTDIIPDHLKKFPEPRTEEERIEQEIQKRVKKRHTSGDLWSARWSGLAMPLVGDFLLSKWNAKRENAKAPDWNYEKWSADTKVWEAGGAIYDKVLAKQSWVDNLSKFFKRVGAGTDNMEKNAPESFNVLQAIEKKHNPVPPLNETRMMVAEQTRMLTKEVGWTIALAVLVENLVGVFNKRRVKHEEKKAIAEITREGLVPEGYKVVLGEGVKLERIDGLADKGSWAEKNIAPKSRPEKAEGFVKALDANPASQQMSLS